MIKTQRIIASLAAIIVVAVAIVLWPSRNAPIQETPKPKPDRLFLKGARLFEQHCVGCHSMRMDLVATAPALGGITTRRDKRWLYSYTKNGFGMFKSGDSIAVALREQNWGLMPPFPMLAQPDLDAIYYFVEKQYAITLAMRRKPQ